ncbi:MAG: hypothetical protein IJ315_02390 [Firmicutes bacterium]|nr:hypothetical protein [Bacillota bacterium]
MQAVWAKGLSEEKNIMVTYQYKLTPAQDAKLVMAASNLYRLFVNGELVGYGPARAAHGYSRMDEYSLAKWAGKETVLAAEVYSANINTYYTVDERPFFAAEILSGGEVVAEGKDFAAYHMTERVQKVRRFSFQRTFTEIYHLTDNPAAFYGGKVGGRTPIETEAVPCNQLIERRVNYPTLETLSGWGVEYGQLGIDETVEPWRDRTYEGAGTPAIKGFKPAELTEDSGKEAGKFTYALTSKGLAEQLDTMSYQIYDFGRTLTGFFKVQVEVKADATLYIIFDEVMDKGIVSPFRNACCNVIKYTLPAGEHELISFEANSARFTTIAVTEGCAKIAQLGMVLYENPDAPRFKYDYHDEELNKIVGAAVNSFAQNAVDVLTDCPSRERAGWLCDSYFSGRAEALFTGKNLVEKSLLENYAICPQLKELPEGMIPMCYPADHNDGIYIPNWTMWYILELRNYCKRTGDEKMREASREKVYGLVKFFSKYYNESGLLENLESWVFIEWSKCNDKDYVAGVNYPSNMLWAAALEAVAQLYDDPALAEKAAQMKQTIREQSWNGKFFEENAIRNEKGELVRSGHTTETCQYYAFYFGTASREDYGELFEKMMTQFGPKRNVAVVYPTVYPSNAIVGNYLRLEILLEHGYKAQVLQECRDFFLGMAELTGTLWEHNNMYASLNHGFASMAAVYIDECMK